VRPQGIPDTTSRIRAAGRRAYGPPPFVLSFWLATVSGSPSFRMLPSHVLSRWKVGPPAPNASNSLSVRHSVIPINYRFTLTFSVCNGPKKCIFVRVVDTCAGCPKGSKHIDLTRAAFGSLASFDEGILTVQFRMATEPTGW
jgi:hypothetical protein